MELYQYLKNKGKEEYPPIEINNEAHRSDIEIPDNDMLDEYWKGITIDTDKCLFYNIDTITNAFNTSYTLQYDFHHWLQYIIKGLTFMKNIFRDKFKMIKLDYNSAESKVILAQRNGSTQFIIKYANFESDKDTIDREYNLGVLVINKLKTLIPNFIYTYGSFNCYSLDTDLEDYCLDIEVGYKRKNIILEYVPGITLTEFIKKNMNKIKLKTMTNILYQIFNALYVAYILYDYTHYDLHGGNIIIRTMKEKVYIPIYDSDLNVKYYILTKYVPYIIDYGFSHAKYKNRDTGITINSQNILSSKSLPGHDISKLLVTIEYELRKEKHTGKLRNFVDTIYNKISKHWTSITNYASKGNAIRIKTYNPKTGHFGYDDMLKVLDDFNIVTKIDYNNAIHYVRITNRNFDDSYLNKMIDTNNEYYILQDQTVIDYVNEVYTYEHRKNNYISTLNMYYDKLRSIKPKKSKVLAIDIKNYKAIISGWLRANDEFRDVNVDMLNKLTDILYHTGQDITSTPHILEYELLNIIFYSTKDKYINNIQDVFEILNEEPVITTINIVMRFDNIDTLHDYKDKSNQEIYDDTVYHIIDMFENIDMDNIEYINLTTYFEADTSKISNILDNYPTIQFNHKIIS